MLKSAIPSRTSPALVESKTPDRDHGAASLATSALMAPLALLLPLLAASTLALVAHPPSSPGDTEFTVRRMRTVADNNDEVPPPVRMPEAALRVTEHVVRLRREDSISVSSMYVQAMRKQAWSRTERDVRLGVSCILVPFS